jgi:multiple sugar transport system permease protein
MRTLRNALRASLPDLWLRLVLIVVAGLWLVPLIWTVSMSLMPNDVLHRQVAGLIPSPLTFRNYHDILQVSAAPRWMLNSAIVAVAMTVLTLVTSAMAGYVFARIPFRGRGVVFVAVLAGLMVPGQALILPLHTMFAAWGMHNTHVALFTPHVAVPFGVFLMTQFFKAVPRELEEAALLDRASHVQIFWRIMLPLSIPALTTLGIFTFLYAWNDFLWPLVSGTRLQMNTVTVGMANLQGNFAQSEGLGFLMACAVFAASPVVVVYLIFQKYVMRGVALGGAR